MARSRFVARLLLDFSEPEREQSVGNRDICSQEIVLSPGLPVVIDGPVINLNYNFYASLKTVSYICRPYSRPLPDETRNLLRVDLCRFRRFNATFFCINKFYTLYKPDDGETCIRKKLYIIEYYKYNWNQRVAENIEEYRSRERLSSPGKEYRCHRTCSKGLVTGWSNRRGEAGRTAYTAH